MVKRAGQRVGAARRKTDSSTKDPGAAPTSTGGEAVPENTIQSVVRACRVLRCCQEAPGCLCLDEIAGRTELPRPTAYRILSTLVTCGMLERPAKNSYRAPERQGTSRKFRIGYASQSEEFSFSRLVSESIRSSAYDAGVDLLVLSNRYSPKVAIRNAEQFVREGVDLVIEFQTNQQSASIIASKLIEAGIPIIAIDIPHPGADYYGANNYRAGVIGGRALGDACLQHWKGEVDEVVLLELSMAGPLPRSRLTGMLAGVRQMLSKVPDGKVRFIDGQGRFEKSLDVVRRYLGRNRTKRVLVGALNDPSCLGALQAFEEAGRSEFCLAVGQNASIEARQEMRRPGSRLVGSVGFFPEQYGEAVIALALDRVRGREIPSATFVKHQLITPFNVDEVYPNDKLIMVGKDDSLLFSRH